MNLFQSRLARYVLIGGLSFAIELSVLLALVSVFGLHRTTAVSISFWISLVVSFALQKFLAFNDRRRKTKILLRQALVFALLVIFNYLFTIFLVALFPDKYLVLSRTLAIIIVSTWNYFIYKNLIFNQHTDKSSHALALATITSRKTYEEIFKKYIASNRINIYLFLALSSGVILFFWQYIATGGKTLMGDFDYYSQLYEAFRTSVLHYGQFPAWNPWMSGGLPLWQNPQFGLISIQSVLVLPFGTIIGMKIAYIIYALLGFWGMYTLSRKSFESDRIRAALVSYIWVFSGFFAGHNIAHFTFTSFFLLPWVIFFVLERNRIKYSWLGLGVVISIITLSSVHYATMFTPLVIAAYFTLSLIRIQKSARGLLFAIRLQLTDLYFIAKALIVFLLLAGWQFAATYRFVSGNERLIAGGENNPTLDIIFQAIFVPVGTFFQAPKTTWGWGEYSMYIGFATLFVIIFIAAQTIRNLFTRGSKRVLVTKPYWVLTALIVGLMGTLLALGDYSHLSLFHLLHRLPGFSQTRVPSRWVLYTIFALLVLIASWRPQRRVINVLLALSVLELFITFGPIRFHGQDWVSLPQPIFSSKFSQHDNNFKHTQSPDNPMSYYWYTTSQNIGQIHADDSLINTLSSSPLLKTSRCANNTDPSCGFVRTNNGTVESWSPNRVVIRRTGPGMIELNMNVESGWRINGEYPYALDRKLDPSRKFILAEGSNVYTIEYAPKLSPSWITWKLDRL